MRVTQVWSLGREDPLEKETATHSSTLAWRIPWREEPGRLQSMGSQRVGHNWANGERSSVSIIQSPLSCKILGHDTGCLQWYWKIRNISITLEMPRVAFQVHNLRLATALPAGSQNLSSMSVILSVQKCPISIITQYMCRLGTGSFCFYLIAWTLIQVVCVHYTFSALVSEE